MRKFLATQAGPQTGWILLGERLGTSFFGHANAGAADGIAYAIVERHEHWGPG